MELQNSSFMPTSTIITLIIFSFIIIFAKLRSKLCPKNNSSSSPNLPPGPRKLPIIGNIHNLVGPLPHHTLRDLSRKYGPLMHLKLGEVSTLIVSSPNMAREFMKTHDLSFAQRPQIVAVQVGNFSSLDIAFAPYGEYWKQMRRICVHELLSSNMIKSFSSIREEAVQNLIESITSSSSSTVNLSEKFMEFTISMLRRLAFGDKVNERDAMTLILGLKEVNKLAAGFDIADLYPSKKFLQVVSGVRAKLEKIHVKIDRVLQAIVDSHVTESEVVAGEEGGESEREGTKEDLVDVLLRLQKSGTLAIPIKTDNIKAVVTDMYSGGTETTSTTMEWAMAELIRNPRAMKKAQAEIRQHLKGKKKTFCEADIQELSYLKLVIKESLRLHPPVPLLVPRECREQCVIDGYEIPLKTRVITNAWAIGRDPKYWEDAESFIPERFVDNPVDYKGANFEFTPFGAGRRMCPGMSFGLANVEIALAQLLYHFDWYLPNGMKPQDLDMTELFGAIVIRKCPLDLVAVPFKPAQE